MALLSSVVWATEDEARSVPAQTGRGLPTRADASPTNDDVVSTTKALVERQLLERMQERDSRASRFTRALPVPMERRVRILDSSPQLDARAARFLRVAIDERPRLLAAAPWQVNMLTGCAYPGSDEVYLHINGQWRPAEVLVAASAADRKRAAPSKVCVPVDNKGRG